MFRPQHCGDSLLNGSSLLDSSLLPAVILVAEQVFHRGVVVRVKLAFLLLNFELQSGLGSIGSADRGRMRHKIHLADELGDCCLGLD